MASSAKPIRTLKTRCNLQDFIQYIPLNPDDLFSELWIYIQETILKEGSFEIIQEIFIKTLHFPKDLSLGLEKKYSKFIKDFSNSLNSGKTEEIKSKLSSSDLKNLLKEVQNFLQPSEDSWVRHLEGLFKFIGVSLVEIGDNFRSPAWVAADELFTVYLYERSEEVFILVTKEPIKLPNLQSLSLDQPDSPLMMMKTEEADDLQTPGDDDSLIDQAGSEDESDWTSVQSVLNHSKAPILTREVEKTASSSPVAGLAELDLPAHEKAKFASAIPLNLSNFLTSLTLAIVNLFTSQNLFHISLQIITNTLYHFPFTHSRSFEQKHVKLTQELLKAFNSEDSEVVQTLLNSSELQSIFEEIEENIEKKEDSLIFPVFPLIRSWRVTLVEKQGQNEYVWKVARPLGKLVLYLFDSRVYLLTPLSKFAVKGLKAKDENLGKAENDENLDSWKDSQEISADDLNLQAQEPDLLLSTDVDDEVLEAHGRPSLAKNVKFKPELTIDIEHVKGSESPSPTYRSALKKTTNLSPDAKKVSPVLNYLENAKKFKNPVERYVARAKSGKE